MAESTLVRQAFLAIETLRQQVRDLEQAAREPIAIVGYAARFPGGADADGFWQLLDAGADAVREVPPERWDSEHFFDADADAAGKSITRRAALLDDVAGFDARFFAISPREAASLDPQHRMLLETSWHALEHAGLAAARLAGSRTGVFMGLSTHEYLGLLIAHTGYEQVGAYFATGTSPSAAAGRISHRLGLEGPAITIDTACSSSLVAVHQAVSALRLRECDAALAGGVNVILTPALMVAMSRARMLAPDGRCKTFDAAADGYVRGEGCGVLVLKRLADAQRDGDPVRAVIKGSAVNQDGASGGLTVPSGAAQQRVIRAALAGAGLEPSAIDYLEAHGTGTSLGDPIEVQAAGAVFSSAGRAAPLLIGSVKTNVGHLEAAAGVAGIIKVVLALEHQRLPRHLHFSTPSPHIPWQRLAVEVVAAARPWPRSERPRRAGVSSFGFSGTNAHVVLEEAPPLAPCIDAGPRWQLLPLSARSLEALRALAALYADQLRTGPSFASICHSAGVGRSHLEHRAGIVADDLPHAIAQLEALAEGRPGVHSGISADPPKTAWLFTGQGSQYPGMGRALYEAEPVFRAVLDHCAAVLQGHLARPLLDVMFEEGGTDIAHTAYAQPALFALEMALARLWQQRGLEPDVVLGHSVGQYAAACVAGVFDLDQGLLLLAERGRLFGALPPGGRMAALFARPATVDTWLSDYPALSVAAYNGAHTVISGHEADVAAVLAACRASGARGELLDTSHAFHSALLEPALDAFEARAASITCHPPGRTLVCNLSGKVLPAQRALDASYWRRHAREPVQFEESVATLAGLGCSLLLEIGPQPVLVASALRAWPDGRPSPTLVPSLRRDGEGIGNAARHLAEALAQLYVAGAQLDFSAIDAHLVRRRIDLPAYPFQRQHHWFQATRAPEHGTAAHSAPAATPASPSAGERLDAAWQALDAPAREPWLVARLRTEVAQALHLPEPQVSADAPFTTLGVDSLTAMELRGRLQAALGATVPLEVFLPHASIAALAAGIARWWSEAPERAGEPQLLPRAPGTPPALSFAQEQLWFLAELIPASSMYNVAVCARIGGPLDRTALARSLETILARHEVLRSAYPTRNGTAQAVVQAPAPVVLAAEEVSVADLDAVLRREACTPFALANGPLLRMRLLRTAPDRHVLTLTMHHIVTDAWSFGILMRELAALYGAYTRGQPSPLPDLTVQYGDHALWQRRWLSGARLARLLDFWRAELAGVPPLILPHDGAASRTPSPRGRRLRFALGRERAASLRQLAERAGTGLFVPLLAAFAALLQRYAGQDDFVVGTMSANRGRLETEGMIGLFVNALPLRVRLDGDPSVRELLARLRRCVLDARAHEEAPFDAVVGAVQKERDGSRNPLFQVQLLLQPANALPPTPDWSIEVEEIDTHTAKRDLTLTLFDDDALSGHLEYALDLFAPERIERMREHFERVVDAMCADIDLRLARVEILTPAERRWQHPALPAADTSAPTFLQQFARSVERTPDAIAILAAERTLTYAQLDRASNRVARHLERCGVKPGTAVALRVARTSAMAVGLLGIFKAGAVYVPVDTTYPDERIAHMLDAARVQYSWDGAGAEHESDAPLAIVGAPSALAYILFTSGSTGRPKGVEIEHAALADYTATLGPALGLAPGDVVLHTASVSFSSSIRQMLVPLAVGACVAIAGDAERRDPLALWRFAAGARASVLDLVPTVLQALSNALQAQGPGPYRPRLLLCASEPLRYALVAQVRALLGESFEWWNLYGQTETTGIVALHRIGATHPDGQRVVPIGRPRPHVGMQVVDAVGQLLPIGVPGRLRITGCALARGYVDDAALTNARFGGTGERCYEAGDIVQLGADGTLEFIGRGDGQVKVRGVRVEPGEVERVLLEHPGVAQAVVLAVKSAGTELVACYVPAGAALPSAALRTHLRSKLPDVMVPARFIALERMPLTANGKLDRAALASCASESGVGDTAGAIDHTPPQPGIEQALAGLWLELLRIPRVSAHDDFFALGGHSLLAAQLRARIEQQWTIELPLATIFEAPTIAALALRIDTLVALAASARAPLLRADPTEKQPALSLAQYNAWRAECRDPSNPAHWIDVTLLITGPLDVERQRAAVHAAIARHDLLRTVYRRGDVSNDSPIIDVLAAWRPPLPLHAPETPAHDLTLGATPPIRIDLVQRAPDQHLLRLRCHRISADGATMRMLLGEIGALYANGIEGSELYPLLDTALGYADYAHWEARWLDAASRRGAVEHFRRVFGAGPLPRLPAVQPGAQGEQLRVALPATVRQALDALARRHAATPVALLAATFARALAGTVCAPAPAPVCLALPVSRRQHPATRRMLGPFMNTLLLRIDLAGDPPFEDSVIHTRQVLREAMACQDAPFEEVRAALLADHGPAAATLDAIALVMEDPAPQGSVQFGDLTLTRVSAPHPVLRRALTLSVGADPDALVLTFTYDGAAYNLPTIRSLAERIEAALILSPHHP